jgi:hypothetical protein
MSAGLIKIEAGMRLALQETGGTPPPENVCKPCFDELTGTMSQGLKLRMERDIRDKNKMLMWKNRVVLVKNGRTFMAGKSYSEAAVQYEKYLRVLEVVYNLKKGEISPTIFNNSKRSKELTVIASVYWDLLRIYDTNPHYGDRMQSAAKKLAEFLPYSTIYQDIVKKAESFMKSARNPGVVRGVVKATKSNRGACFIADAAFADQPLALEPFVLRRYRDEVLRGSKMGRRLIWTYYRVSPSAAAAIRRHPRAAALTRRLLHVVARHLHARHADQRRL